MARRLNISISGSPPFGLMTNHLVKDDDFLVDAQRIIAIEKSQFDQLQSRLETFDSFLDRDEVGQITEAVIGPTGDAQEIARTIWRIASILRESDEPLEKAVGILRTSIIDKMEKLEPASRELLVNRLEELTARPLGFDRQHKAQQLETSIGCELESSQIICDLRPVFDAARSKIEGALPIAIMHLEVNDGGSTSALDVRLTNRQLQDLAEKVDNATKKLSAIECFATEKGITIPKLSSKSESRE